MQVLALASDAAALFFLWLFGFAAWHKLNGANRDYYLQLMSGYGLNERFARLSLPAVGISELGIGLGLVIPAVRFEAGMAAAGLLLFYTVLMVVHRSQRDMDCGCAGPSTSLKIGPQLIWRNIFLLSLVLLCALPGSGEPGFLLLSGLAAALMIVFYHALEQLIANAQKLTALNTE